MKFSAGDKKYSLSDQDPQQIAYSA